MTSGTFTRQVATDNLAGQADMQPVTLQGPGIMQAAPIEAPRSAIADVAAQLTRWGSKKLEAQNAKENEAAYLEGQMAYQQGQAFEDVKMGGNKWALEGYMVMDSQTIASSLLAAQREDIAQQGHVLSPDEFRAQFTDRVKGAVAGKDPRTAKLVQEQMLKQLPVIVADHTAQHMRFKEGKNFESLERSIDIISRDPTATDELVSFAAGGDGAASSGLSDERRHAAVVSGVVRAFANDNPMAYSALAGAGLLKDMSTADTNAIAAARGAFENRRRSEYDAALFDGEQALMSRVEAGLSPSEAIEELSVLYADHDINMNMADAGAIYNKASGVERSDNLTQATLYEDAALRGDWQTTAKITEAIMIQFESGGNPNAVSPAGARGTHQVMDATNLDPGYGVRPAQDDSPEERARVGSDYWAMLHKRYNGDLEAVAVGYNAGPGNADKWLAGGRDYSVLPKPSETKPYAQGIIGALKGWAAPTAADRLSIAQATLAATRERLAMDTYEALAPGLTDNENAFIRGDIDRDTYESRNDELYGQYGVARTRADVDHELTTATSVENALTTHREKLAATQASEDAQANAETAQLRLMAGRATYDAVVNDPASSPQTVAEATRIFREHRQAVFDEAGIPLTERGNVAANEAMYKQMTTSMDRHRAWRAENAEIQAAISGGYVGELPRNLQQRAFEDTQAQIVQRHSDNLAKGQYDEATANAMIAEDANAFYAQAGTVDPKMAREASAIMRGPLLDKDGNPNPAIVDTVQNYAELKAMNPRAAASMLTEPERILAEGILTRSSDGMAVGEGVRLVGIDMQGNSRVEDVDSFMARPDVIRATNAAADSFIADRDIGIFQVMFDGGTDLHQMRDTRISDEDTMQGAEMREAMVEEVRSETARLRRIAPNMRVEDLAMTALENVERRTEIIGGQVVNTRIDIRKEFFGSKANDFRHPGDVNSAIMQYLRTDEAQRTHGFSNDVTGTEYMPAWMQSTVKGILAAPSVVGLPDLGADWTPSMSLLETLDSEPARIGVRPFDAYATADGKGIVIQVHLPNGRSSEPFVLPMREVGEAYLTSRKASRIK